MFNMRSKFVAEGRDRAFQVAVMTECGIRPKEIAEALGIHYNTALRWVRKYKETRAFVQSVFAPDLPGRGV